jgi:outer membrane protein OmpA-like peptidoglycan-associated protein
MSSCWHRRALIPALLIGLTLLFGVAEATAQEDETPKFELFTGYQWLHPGATVPAPGQNFNSPVGLKFPDLPDGAGGSLTYFFDKYVGLEGDFGRNWNDHFDETTVSIGPKLETRSEGVNFFANTLLSWNHVTTTGLNGRDGIGAILGGGMDLEFSRRFGIRVFEADYVWTHQNFSDVVSQAFPDLRRVTFNGVRLRTGLEWYFGYPPTAAPTATCSIQPSEVMVGEPLTATATPNGFNPKHPLTYQWGSNGGKITGKDSTASIDTAGIAGGSYTATVNITDPKVKKNGTATCSANFTVKEPPKNPPTMSCSANPNSLQAGGTVTVHCTCTSPDNVPVSVSNWTTTGGTVSASGDTATENTAGASPGAVTITATCTDSRGLSSSSSAQINVENPPPPSPQITELETRLALHSVYFATAQPAVANPHGGLLPSQQRTLTVLATDFVKYLQAKPDAKLILEGHADPRGTVEYNQALSERRVESTKAFLVANGVPADNIETRALGQQHNLTPDEVKQAVETNPELSSEERARVLRNMRTIILASNRRVDITLSTTGQQSVRQFPFNSTDSLTLIGGRESELKGKKTGARKTTRKPAPKQ